MQRLVACLLAVCFGLVLPAAGGPACVCLASLTLAPAAAADCCDDCEGSGETRPDCCIELRELPEAPLPESAPGVPAAPAIELDRCAGVAMTALPIRDLPAVTPAARDDGGPPPSERRCRWGVWRL